MLSSNSANPEEIKKFEQIADQWWSSSGKFAILHKFNLCRVAYIKNKIYEHFNVSSAEDLGRITVLDVGCGGGLLSEPLAKLGLNVSAIDASEKNIAAAKIHASKQGLKINYKSTLIENMPEESKYNVVMVMEVIEHVDNPKEFLINCTKLLAPGGLLFVATINRTLKSLLLAKFAAEYVLNWLPKNAHDWNKFHKPSEIVRYLEDIENMEHSDLTGAKYNLFKDSWHQSQDVSQNYMLLFKKSF